MRLIVSTLLFTFSSACLAGAPCPGNGCFKGCVDSCPRTEVCDQRFINDPEKREAYLKAEDREMVAKEARMAGSKSTFNENTPIATKTTTWKGLPDADTNPMKATPYGAPTQQDTAPAPTTNPMGTATTPSVPAATMPQPQSSAPAASTNPTVTTPSTMTNPTVTTPSTMTNPTETAPGAITNPMGAPAAITNPTGGTTAPAGTTPTPANPTGTTTTPVTSTSPSAP